MQVTCAFTRTPQNPIDRPLRSYTPGNFVPFWIQVDYDVAPENSQQGLFYY